MQADFVAQLAKTLSDQRLAAYQGRVTEDGNLNLFSHYAWNMALSESLYPILQALEISLRNAIHHAAVDHFNQDNWFDDRSIIHHRYNQTTIANAKLSLERQNKPIEPDRIIAELTFGFWTSLLDRRYEQGFLYPIIRATFPHIPRRDRTRHHISQRFNKIRDLRNRVFHHEPIWYWNDLAQQHQDMLEALVWMAPAMKEMVMTIDRFEETYNNGFDNIKKQLEKFC
jgi:hypothetical protein